MNRSIQISHRRGLMSILCGCAAASVLALTTAAAYADPNDPAKQDDSAKKAEKQQKETSHETAADAEKKAQKAEDRLDRQEKRANREFKEVERESSGNKLEKCLATVLIQANENEIRASQIAQERASSAEVKKFAQMMEQEHKEILSKLESYGEGKNLARKQDKKVHETAFRFKPKDGKKSESEKADQGDEGKIQQTSAEEPRADDDAEKEKADKDNAGGTFHHQMMNIHQELAAQCRQTMEKELTSKTGEEFDDCYVGMQIGAHMHMVDMLTVFERHASGDFKNVLTEGLQTTQSHLEHAKSLMKSLEGEENKTANVEAK